MKTHSDLEFGSVSWKDLLSSLREEAVIVGNDLRVHYANLPILKRMGTASRDLVGQPCRRVFYDDEGQCDGQEEDCPVRMVLKTGKPVSVLRRQTRSQGYRYYIEVTALPMKDAGGKTVAVLCLPRELGLDERYQRIFNTMREGVAVVSPSGRLVDVNAALCEMLGYQREDLSRLRATDFVPAKLANSWLDADRPDTYVEVRMTRKDGTLLDTEISVSPLRLGPVTLYVAFVRDISRLKVWQETIAKQAQALADSAAQYQALFDSSGDVLLVVEDDTTIAMVNRRFEERTGFKREEVEGKMSTMDLVDEADREREVAVHRLLRERPEEILPRHSTWVLAKDGSRWLADVSGVIIPGTNRSLLDLRDTTEAHNLQQELLDRNREMGALISVTGEMASTLDLQTVLDRTLALVCTQIGATHGFLCILDEQKGELRATAFWGETMQESGMVWAMGEGLVGWVAEHKQAVVWDDARADPHIKLPDTLKDGDQSVVAVPLEVRDKVFGVVAAVTRQKESLSGAHLRLLTAYASQASLALENALLYQEVKGQASTDQLTGLYNRRHFETRFEEELRRAKRYDHPLSLLFMDVNHLKVVNDRYGHLQGDVLLRHVGHLLIKVLRTTDIAARYGGDEFVVLLPEITGNEAANVAERIIREATPCPLLSGGSIPWGISVGVSWVPTERGYDIDLLLLADEAAYRAKREGTGWARAQED